MFTGILLFFFLFSFFLLHSLTLPEHLVIDEGCGWVWVGVKRGREGVVGDWG